LTISLKLVSRNSPPITQNCRVVSVMLVTPPLR
jgi:hypothetical protein